MRKIQKLLVERVSRSFPGTTTNGVTPAVYAIWSSSSPPKGNGHMSRKRNEEKIDQGCRYCGQAGFYSRRFQRPDKGREGRGRHAYSGGSPDNQVRDRPRCEGHSRVPPWTAP